MPSRPGVRRKSSITGTRTRSLKLRRFLDAHAQKHRDEQERERGKKRESPAPRIERFRRQEQYERESATRQQRGDRRGELHERGEAVAIGRRGVLDRHGHGTAPLAADRDPLQESQHDEHDRGDDSDGIEVGQHANERGRDTDQHDAENQCGSAANAIAQAPEEHRAQGPCNEPHAEGRECGERGGLRVKLGEEQPVEHQRRGEPKEVVVKPFHRGADERGERDLSSCLQ